MTTPIGSGDDLGQSVAVQYDGKVVVAGYSSNGSNNDFALARYLGHITEPELAVEQPAGANIADGGSKDFGSVHIGSNTSLTFTIRNTGNSDLTGLTVTKDGINATDFIVTANPITPVSGPSGTTTFTVQFAPSAAGSRTAAIHIANNDSDENPFDITLIGTGVAPNIAVTVSPASVMEDGATNLTFTFTRTGVTTGALTANFSVSGSAAHSTDYAQSGAASYTTSTGTVTFAAGSATAIVIVNPVTESVVEDNETVILSVTSGTGYTVGTPASTTGTITNDDTDIGNWRQTHFGSTANSGDGADMNDFDKDGIPNLVEFAFGLNPKQNSTGLLPKPQKAGSEFIVSFTRPIGVSAASLTVPSGARPCCPEAGRP